MNDNKNNKEPIFLDFSSNMFREINISISLSNMATCISVLCWIIGFLLNPTLDRNGMCNGNKHWANVLPMMDWDAIAKSTLVEHWLITVSQSLWGMGWPKVAVGWSDNAVQSLANNV